MMKVMQRAAKRIWKKLQVRKLTTLNKRVFPKDRKYEKLPSHILANVELGEGGRFRFVPSFAGGDLDISGRRSWNKKTQNTSKGENYLGCFLFWQWVTPLSMWRIVERSIGRVFSRFSKFSQDFLKVFSR